LLEPKRPFSGCAKPEQTNAANVPFRDATEPFPHRHEVQMLIADLGRRVQLLDADIQDEEKRTGIFDASNVCYTTLARNLRARRNNLLVTITMLQSQLVEADTAA
jgi:hypothetical protein